LIHIRVFDKLKSERNETQKQMSHSTGKLTKRFQYTVPEMIWSFQKDMNMLESDSEDENYLDTSSSDGEEDEQDEQDEEDEQDQQDKQDEDVEEESKGGVNLQNIVDKIRGIWGNDVVSEDDSEEDETYKKRVDIKDMHKAMFSLLNNYRFLEQVTSFSAHVYRVYDHKLGTGVLKIARLRGPCNVRPPKEVRCMIRCQDIKGMMPLWRWHMLKNRHYAMFMPMVKDDSLSSVLGNMKNIQNFMSQMLTTLDACLDRGVWHRDIKPGNIFWNEDTKEVMVTDMDCATLYPERIRHDRIGTEGFFSPEMKSGSGYNWKTDIFSSGVIFAMLLHGLDNENDVDNSLVKTWMNSSQIKVTCKSKQNQLRKKTSTASGPKFEGDKDSLSLMNAMLRKNPKDRPTYKECLQHSFFDKTYNDK
jgi:serine/threonine protein kinase